MCKRNLKKLALNLPSSTTNAHVTQKSAIVMPNSHSDTKVVDMQESTSSIYQQGPACILPNLYLGACYNADNATQLTRHGITCIINVASEIKIHVPLPHIEYHHIKWTHAQRNLATSEFDKAIETIRIAHDNNQTVLIHCQQGIERSAALILAYLLKTSRCMKKINANMNDKTALAGQNWSLDYTLNFVKEKAPCIRPNMELLYQLREYEQSIPMQQTQHMLVEKRHNIRNRTKRSESVTCSKPSTRSTLLTSSSSLRSLSKVLYQQRPRSASFRETSSSANLTISSVTSATTAAKNIDKRPLAVAALIIVLVAVYQRECYSMHQSVNNDQDTTATAATTAANHTHLNSNLLLINSIQLKPIYPIY